MLNFLFILLVSHLHFVVQPLDFGVFGPELGLVDVFAHVDLLLEGGLFLEEPRL
mgnify:CR=1 FL=1